MKPELKWKKCPDCGCPMLPAFELPSLGYGCHSCGEFWHEEEALDTTADDHPHVQNVAVQQKQPGGAPEVAKLHDNFL